MDSHARRWSLERLVVIGAIAFGVAAGSYGIASAASGSGSSTASGSASYAALLAAGAPAANTQSWGVQRSDETLLTDGTASKVKAAALAKVPGGTIVRVETDADGNAAYEAHMVSSDGTPVTVYVNKQFEVVSVENGMPGPPAQGGSGA
jgi:hypothetical protein